MRSFIQVATLVLTATLGLLVSTTSAQDISAAFSKSGVAGPFRDPLNSLNSLTVGPYPSLATAGFEPVAVGGAQGLAILDKRQYTCNPGYGYCGTTRASPTATADATII
ncbi:hypothetical protein BGZ98_000017 [Dissophora globulifera]|nr:hypothetical protein BGZ98_000017 [Dissophora globulifera]